MNQMSQQQTTFPRIWTEIINNTLPINGVLKPDTSVVKRERAEGKQKKKKRGGGGGVLHLKRYCWNLSATWKHVRRKRRDVGTGKFKTQ